MDISLIVKIAGVGLLIAATTQVLNKTGRDEQAMMVTLAGILVVLGFLVAKIGELFETISTLFGL